MPTQVKVGWRSFVSPVTSSYLLDTYAGATAAYSLRKLRTAYTGSAIRVRRSSDNTEQNIGFTSTGGLDTTALLSFVGAGNGFVTTWYDQGASGYNLTQSIASNQPSIVLSGVLNTENNKPILITDFNSYMFNDSLPINGTTNSIFATIKMVTTRGNISIMSGYNVPYNQHFVSRDANGYHRYYDSNSNITASPLPNGLNLIGIHENSSGVTVYENGANLVTNFAHDVNNTTGIMIFRRNVNANEYMPNGSGFAELIVYGNSSKLSDNSAISNNINSYYSIYSTLDTDAQAFITAASITDATQQSAVNTLVTSLKSAGIWTKLKAVYPFVGGTANSHKFNLKDPRDLDAAYRLVFSGGWVHSSTGAKPNGTTGYANTGLVPNTVLQTNSTHLSYYSRTNVLEPSTEIMAASGGSSVIDLYVRFTDGNMLSRIYNSTLLSSSVPSSQGFFIMNRPDVNTAKQYRNSTLLSSSSLLASTKPTIPLLIGCGHNNGAIYGFSTKETAFASIGDGLTDTEATAFYTAVQTFQTTLGRHVGVPIVADTDAQAFLNAAVITDTTQASAINTLVTSLKSANIWTKMKAIYPFVGGTATSHKFNLKDPRDLDAAYRLVFNGGWTHSSTGALPNGTNAYADTKLIPIFNLSLSSTHFSKYNRTNDLTGNKIDGTANNTYSSFFQHNYASANTIIGVLSSMVSYTPTDTRGFFISTRTSNVVVKAFRNNSQLGSTNTNFSNELPNQAFYLGARNSGIPSDYNNYESAFASIGDGLTDAEATAFYNAVQAYQTTLGRQV